VLGALRSPGGSLRDVGKDGGRSLRRDLGEFVTEASCFIMGQLHTVETVGVSASSL